MKKKKVKRTRVSKLGHRLIAEVKSLKEKVEQLEQRKPRRAKPGRKSGGGPFGWLEGGHDEEE